MWAFRSQPQPYQCKYQSLHGRQILLLGWLFPHCKGIRMQELREMLESLERDRRGTPDTYREQSFPPANWTQCLINAAVTGQLK